MYLPRPRDSAFTDFLALLTPSAADTLKMEIEASGVVCFFEVSSH